ncbi:MAG: VacJ family lipoprotein [Novosphingobium sp.]
MILPALAPLLLLGAAGQPASAPVGPIAIDLVALASTTGTQTPAKVEVPAPVSESTAGTRDMRPSGDAPAPPIPAPIRTLDETPKAGVARRRHHAPGDPLEGFNRRMFAVHQGLDKALIRPAALGYRHVVPRPLRTGLRHVFRNLNEPIVFLNYLLQLKPGKAAETLGRFLVNSTLGVGGLVDVAKRDPFRLPHRPNGFGNTLGRYGVGPGPYLFLPLVGPSDLRDFVANQADSLVLPVAVGTPFDRAEYQVPRSVLAGLDQRAESDDELRTLFASAIDPYATLRSVYLQNRASEIAALRGKHGKSEQPPAELDDPLNDPEPNADIAPEPEAAGDSANAPADAAIPIPEAELQAFTPAL